jgi:uncharacterized SAM-binding protein YcdF (DUF218 family)
MLKGSGSGGLPKVGSSSLLLLLFYSLLALSLLLLYYQRSSSSSHSGDDRAVIIVLGGGLLASGDVPVHTEQRLMTAVKLYKDLYKATSERPLIITLSQGTTHKPNPTDKAGFATFEATAASKWLLDRAKVFDILPSDVMEENLSLDTIGNAYFLRVIHIDPGQLKNLYVITNDWHMERSRAIFEYVFSLPDTSKLGLLSSIFNLDSKMYNLNFVSAPSGIPDSNIVEKRRQRERQSLISFQSNTVGKFANLKELHSFMFVQHKAYASSRVTEKDYHNMEAVDPELLKTY